MATETLPAAHDREETDISRHKRKIVVVVGGGQNTDHMRESLEHLPDVHIFEVNEPLIPVDADHLHRTDTEEGRRSAAALIGSGAVRAVYLSVVPELHAPLLKQYLEDVAENRIDFIVLPKPYAQNVRELRDIRAMLAAAIARRRELDPDYDPEKNPMLVIHEHYIKKGAWDTLRTELGRAVDILGRLESVTIDIQEERTAEDEGRTKAFQGGALEDLGPHVISLGLNIQSSINTGDRYTIPDRSNSSIERFRYEGSELPENVETSFIIRGHTTIDDAALASTHDVTYTWRGGKGLVDKKAAVLTFVHPDTGEQTTILVDLRKNALVAPRSVGHVFGITEFDEDGYGYREFDDNGYGHSVEVGLGGADPLDSFQAIGEAEVVTKLQEYSRIQGRQAAPTVHRRGSELRQLATAP